MLDVSTKQARDQFYHSVSWRALRQKALERDHYECIWCKAKGKVVTDNLEVDHIKELKDDPEGALDLENLRTLCKDCHNERHARFSKKSNCYRNDEWWGG